MATFEKRVGASGKVTWRVRVRKSSGPWLSETFATKDAATKWATKIESQIDEGVDVPNAETRKRTLADAIDRYLAVTLPNSKHKKNAAEQTRILTWWKATYGDRRLTGIKAGFVDEVQAELRKVKSRSGQPLSGATINRRVTALSAVLTTAVTKYGWLQKNPITKADKLPDSKGRERFLSASERTALIDACASSYCQTLQPLVELALATGGRKGELFALRWADVDLVKRTVRFRDTKNGESRTVPLAPAAIATLKTWRADRLPVGAVFPESPNVVDKAWQAARDDAGVTDFRFHDLRHSAASYLAMSGASLMDIAAILGHKTLAMVKRYSHLSEQHTTAAIDRMAEKFLA